MASEFQISEHDAAEIRAIIAGMTDAWAAGDGNAFGRHFAADADYTVWNGRYLRGREAIAEGHTRIFNTVYKDTRLRLDVTNIRLVRPGVAVAHAVGSVVGKDESFPDRPTVTPVFVLTREDGRWRIAVFHNTRIDPEESG
jgi:uncharacterized protein (TIGR02246 family)